MNRLWQHGTAPDAFLRRLRKAFNVFKTGGFAGVAYLLRQKVERGLFPLSVLGLRGDISSLYRSWIRKNEPTKNQRHQLKLEMGALAKKPRIDIVIGVDADAPVHAATLQSVLDQLYDAWTLWFIGDPTDFRIDLVLKDPRIRKATRSGFNAQAQGEFVVFLGPQDILAPFALPEIVKLINQDPAVDFIYSDEDFMTSDGARIKPKFKPDWSPDLLRSANYIGNLRVVRREILDQLGGLPAGYDVESAWDICLRIGEKAQNIRHIPKVLYHRRVKGKKISAEAGRRIIEAHLRRIGRRAAVEPMRTGGFRVRYEIAGAPKVSIIIPTRDRRDVLKACVDSVLNKTSYANYEIVIVDNQSSDPAALSYLAEIQATPRVKVLRYAKPYNYSVINNFAVDQTSSDYVLFLNNDTEVISCDWIEALLEQGQRPEVGAVGALLYYPNDKIQHAGVIVGIMGIAGHSHKLYPRGSRGYCGRINFVQNFSAVTAACLLTRREEFQRVGGFDRRFSRAFNDVDLCLRLRQRGLLVVYTPFAELYHYESLSRGSDYLIEGTFSEYRQTVTDFQARWEAVLKDGDPYYNTNLSRVREDFSIRI